MDSNSYDSAEQPEQPETPEGEEAAPVDYAEPEKVSDDELIARAMACYRLGIDTTSEWREQALEDLEFLAGDQWDSNVKANRDTQGRPALTINRLPQFVRQVTNEQRQSKPSVTVSPMDSEGNSRTAEVFQGIIRAIEYGSNADAAYAAGGEAAARTGLGYWDVSAEYEHERSFEQTLSISRIKNPLSVVMDPGAKEMAGDDARWCIISTDISKAEWEALYPDKDMPIGVGAWEGGLGDSPAGWVGKEGVRLHEYRYVTEETDTLFDMNELKEVDPIHFAALKLADVDVSSGAVLASDVGADHAATLRLKGVSTRSTTKRKVCWAKIAGGEVVDKGELAGRYLQLVRVVGSEIDVNGKTVYEGVVRQAKDTQRALNYFVSAEAEAVALAPKAPWLIAEGQDEGYEADWQNANTRALSSLKYKPTTLAGQPVPAPQRVNAEANISAITTARQQAGQDLSDVTGIYPTQFGAPTPEQSGKAILARQSQGQTSNFHFQDNFGMAIRYTGRILVDLIPKIYSSPRIMRIIGEDQSHEMVPVNGQVGTFRGEEDVTVKLSAGRYDVAVSMGPSYLSRRQEAAAQMMELARINPIITQVAGDLMVASMDIPGGDVIADRLRKLLPPEIRPPDAKQPPPQVMMQTIQQMQMQGKQMQNAIDQLSQALHNAHDRIDAKEQDIQSKERIALIQATTELAVNKAKLNSSDANAWLERQQTMLQRRMDLDGFNDPPDDTSTAEAPRGLAAVLKEVQQPQPQPTPAPGALNGRQPIPFLGESRAAPGGPGPGEPIAGVVPGGIPGVPGGIAGGPGTAG